MSGPAAAPPAALAGPPPAAAAAAAAAATAAAAGVHDPAISRSVANDDAMCCKLQLLRRVSL